MAHSRFFALLLLNSLLACGGAEKEPSESDSAAPRPELMSLLGEPLYARPDAEGLVAKADEALAKNPTDIGLILAAAGARAAVWRYNEAIDLFTKAVELAPNDWLLYRYRGHRYITLRQFDKAVADLEKARELSPYSFDVAYHLGLAYYLQGRFKEAADEYGRCTGLAEDPNALFVEASEGLSQRFRTCMEVGRKESTRVAITDWRYRALRRAGRHAEARALLETVAPDWSLDTNTAYYAALLFYKGLRNEPDTLTQENEGEDRFETVAYGVANWHLAEGNTARAMEILNQVARDPHWPGFGRIAAEVDLARLTAVEKQDPR